jgi:hypothetical protein
MLNRNYLFSLKVLIPSNHPNFGEQVHISTNENPIKTFTNHPFSSVNPIIFPEANLQFNVSTVKVNFPNIFKLTVFHNISLYQTGSNIQAENIPTYIYCDTVIDSNKNKSIYIVNLKSNFFTTPLSTAPANLLSFFLEGLKRTKINISKTRETLYIQS